MNEDKQLEVEQEYHTEALFNQINKLIKNVGLKKAILHIKAFNENNNATTSGANNSDIYIYEFIIQTVLETFKITEKDLYKGNGGFTPADARRTAYCLIYKYLKHSHDSISLQFNKSRTTITMSINEFSSMLPDRRLYRQYFELHDQAEKKVMEYIQNLRGKSSKSTKKKTTK